MTLSPARAASLDPTSSRDDGGGALAAATSFATLGSLTATSRATAFTAGGANTKGSYVQLVASTATSYASFILCVNAITISDYLFDVAIGGAGSEVVIASNILVSQGGVAEVMTAVQVWLPISIPASTRVSARCQAKVGASIGEVAIIGIQGGPTTAASVTTYGADTSDSGGVAVDAGATPNTKGAWSQITAATTSVIDTATFLIGSQQNRASGNSFLLMDIGTGGAGAEVVLVADVPLHLSSSTDLVQPQVIRLPVGIPNGTRVAVRAQCSVATASDRAFDVVMLGFTA